MSADVSMKQLLESGVHFGHRTNKWEPKMKPYIFTERNGIHIIDLQQTVKFLGEAYNFVRDLVAEDKIILFLGTKRQAQETIQEEAERCGMPYVYQRWLPGTLTNWITIFQRIKELERLEEIRDSGKINKLVKKEGLMIERQIKRLLVYLSGIRNLKQLPDALFIVDVMREATAVHEANLKNVPVVAMVDTNCDPDGIDYLIPANDDAIRAIKLLVAKIADAVIEGKALRKEEEELEEAALMEGAEGAEEMRGRIELEEELEDEDLLGAATLAKLTRARKEMQEDKDKDLDLDMDEEEVTEKAPQEAAEKPKAAEKEKAPKEVEKPKAKAKPAKAEKKEKKPEEEQKPAAKPQVKKEAAKKEEKDEIPEGAFKLKLSDSELPANIISILEKAGIKNAGDLAKIAKSDPSKLTDLSGIGPKYLKTIQTFVKKLPIIIS